VADINHFLFFASEKSSAQAAVFIADEFQIIVLFEVIISIADILVYDVNPVFLSFVDII
jgi:hypothetical protein